MKRPFTFFLAAFLLSTFGGESGGGLIFSQSLSINMSSSGSVFDGIGVVNGGGATSVLLKDYPAQQQKEILDMVYRPMWGASVSALLVEIPGDGNSTQGSMPSHAHVRGEKNYHRGYTWWILQEAKRRNPYLTLDAAAWSAPGWIGNGNFWSQDAVDYYVDWLQGLRQVYGLELTALGCRNEKGVSYEFVKMLRKGLDNNGFKDVAIHAFDNWYDGKLSFLSDMLRDSVLRQSIDIVGGHTFYDGFPVKPKEKQLLREIGKPLWNTEDHVYKRGFDCLISIVECFNRNYIDHGATKVVNWYDICGTYPLEPYSEEPPMVLAYEPWSGHYLLRDNLWGYAHYGQFTKVGWHYVDDGCRHLDAGGTMVTMCSDHGDWSMIIETKGARQTQTLTVDVNGVKANNKLCLWNSNSTQQFVRLDDIRMKNGRFTLTLNPDNVYSLSTTKGQKKGLFADIPESKPFPLPYSDGFEDFASEQQRMAHGYLPHYTADIAGAFELTDRPDGSGTCIRQMVPRQTISWAPDWHQYTIIGDSAWCNYTISADVYLDEGEQGGIMGRICHVGTGYGIIPKGYYFKVAFDGRCSLVVSRGRIDKNRLVGDKEQQELIRLGKDEGEGGEKVLWESTVEGVGSGRWIRLGLNFSESVITCTIDGHVAAQVTDRLYDKGMAGLIAPKLADKVCRPYFDNLKIE